MPDETLIDYSVLIPDLREWNNGDGIGVDEWLNFVGNFQLAIAFSRMFWPTFVEHDGCVLFAGFSLDTYNDFLRACNGDRTSVEAVMNHRHILDLFCQAADTATAAQIVYVGRVLKDILSVKLKHDFPKRSFEVQFDEGPLDELIDYQITFWHA